MHLQSSLGRCLDSLFETRLEEEGARGSSTGVESGRSITAIDRVQVNLRFWAAIKGQMLYLHIPPWIRHVAC